MSEMAHNVEPMDISMDGDFDNKENTFHHSNVLSRTPCTEKGYEELDVSELNMKLRYSITPASSPMSKSYTAHCLDNRNSECPDNTSYSIDNANLTRSFNSMLTKNDTVNKTTKLQPLQLHMADQSSDNNRNTSVLRPLDTTVTGDGNNVTVTVTDVHDIDENLSLPSSSSSALHTPEATTPTKDMPKGDGGSPIMRGLKSVLNMFRASQSPIPPAENEDISSLGEVVSSSISSEISQVALASTPIASRNKRESSSKRGSPLKDSVVFNEDLEKELLWKDETTILFSEEKIPIHKLFYQQPKNASQVEKVPTANAVGAKLNETVEFMDVSYNDSVIINKTFTDVIDAVPVAESDSEFVDCETTFTQQLDDEKNTELDTEHTATVSGDVSVPVQTINKSTEELQILIGEECNQESINTTNDKGTLVTPNQNAHGDPGRNVEKIHEIVPTQSNYQETDNKSYMETEKEFLSRSSFTMESQVCRTPLLSSPLNATQDYTAQKEPLGTTVIVDNVEKSEFSLTAPQDTDVNMSIHKNKLDATVNIESNDKPVSVSLFIMNSTQNVTQLASNCLNDPVNTTVTQEDKSVLAPVLSTENINNQHDTTQDFKDKQILSASLTKIDQSKPDHLNATVTESDPVLLSTDVNNITQVIDAQSNKESNNTLGVKVSSSDMAPSTLTLNATQDIESNVASAKNGNTLDATVTIDHAEKPASSTLITDITQDMESHMSALNTEGFLAKDKHDEILDSTVTVDPTENPVSSTFIKDITQDMESHMNASNTKAFLAKDKNHEILDGTVTVDPTEKPVSSTFIKDITQFTQDMDFHMSALNAEAYLAQDKNDEILDSTVTVNPTEKPVSSTFVTDISQDIESHISTLNAETYLEKNKNDEILDGTVTVDPSEKPVSSTFITDITQNLGISTSVDNKQISLDSVKLLDSETKPVSSTFVNDNQAPGIELSEITIAAECIQTQTTFSKDIPHIIDSEVAISQNNDISNSSELDNENCMYVSSNSLNLTSSTNKSPTLSKDYLGNAEKKYVESTSDVNNAASVSTTGIEEKASFDTVLQSTNDMYKPTEVSVPMTATKDITTVFDKEKQMSTEQDKPKENIQNSSGDAAKLGMDKIDANVVNMNSTKTVTVPDNKSYGDLPVDIPLPEEDEIEFEPLPDQLAHENTSSNSGVLPDFINDLSSSKIQDVNQIDEVPIITNIDHVKTPADLITDTLYFKTEISESNNKSIIERNDSDPIETKNSDLVEQVTLTENIMASAQSIEKEETKAEYQPDDLDISYKNQGISSNKDGEFLDNQNITHTINNNEKEKETKDKSEINVPFGTLENLELPEVHVQSQNVSFDNIDINTKTQNESESIHIKPNNVEGKNEIIREQIVVSESNSPFVLVSVEKDNDNKPDSSLEEDFEKIDNPYVSKSNISALPPTSPPIVSKGYNFNFDEIDDPFATKTKIRSSPDLDSPKQNYKPVEKVELARKDTVNKNKRKSYPVRPKPAITKNNSNKSFDGSLSTQHTTGKSKITSNKKPLHEKDVSLNKPENVTEDSNILHDNINSETNVIEKSELEQNIDSTSKSAICSENKNKEISFDELPITQLATEVTHVDKSPATSTAPSSSDQSIYLSAGTSSIESITNRTKNVFNLPEIDYINFNPFATKSKIRVSPPPSLEMVDPIITETENKTNEANVGDKLDLSQQDKLGLDEKDSSNVSIATCSSKDDKNATVREVHTDNDDTIEGPFLETEDTEMIDSGLQNEIKNKVLAGLDVENDMMEFSDLPAQDNEDNEMFIDAASYEFLLNQNKSNVITDSGKESLFLKFDPLFAKRLSSEGIAAALNKIQKRQSTPKKMSRVPPLPSSEQAFPGPSTSNVSLQQLDTTEDIAEDLNITTSKPMMVVTPAVNQIAKPRKSTTPTSSNRRSITFTSPAIAVIDRLLSLSANNSLVDQNTTITHVSREHDEAEQALTQLRELLAEKEINVYNLRTESTELKDRLLTLESQMKVLEKESEERLKKVNELNEKLTEKTKINKSMAAVVEEYERTIASLIAETEQDRKRHDEERTKLIKERDEQTAHLASMEVSFSDLHSKYEKSKQIILSCKANEDTYKKSIKEFEENLTKMQTNYETLKQHASAKLNHANQELEKMNKAHESEVLKLNAMIKRKELHITSLEETLAQKTKANEELTAICDELINKVG